MKAYLITIIVIACIIAAIIVFKIYLKVSAGWDRSPTCLVGKTVIVTGANTGIGFYTAQDLAKRGARVILACRDPIRAEQAKTKIVEATGNPNVVVKIIDFASLASVRKFAVEVKASEPRLDILVNNAGAGGLAHSMTSDGLSTLMQINYFGPFLLTILLISLLKKSTPSRVVNVASSVAPRAKLNLNDLNAFPRAVFGKFVDYANTKLCNILFTNELARKLQGSGVDTNSLCPGAVQTDFARNVTGAAKKIVTVITKSFYKTTEEGAQTSIYVAVSKDISGISGEFFTDCRKAQMPKQALNQDVARKLWEKSVDFVKLSADERQLV